MDCQKLILTTFILVFFWLTGSVKNTVSQPSLAQCPLDFGNFTQPQNFTCEEGTWNDFLRDKCCKDPFNMYLDALALRANQTGEIYLNSTEQTSCLTQMKDNITDVFSCGIDKLTNGVNGCSDLSVQDVLNELHDEVEGLLAGCGLLGHGGGGDGGGYWHRSCENCVQSWKEIKGITSRDGDADLCRFAVLTTLTGSRIDDFIWMQNIHKCLGEQVTDKGSGSGENAKKKKKKLKNTLRALHLDDTKYDGGTPGRKKNINYSHLIGLLSGISALVLICIYIVARRWHRSHTIANEDGMKRDLPKKSQYLKVPVKEIHYATNNLDQLNYIGEGTAGKVYRGILSNKKHVAVKHIINEGFVETFLREVRNLALVRHPNLVALLGYCDNGDECFLIYELCTNGNLSEWLFGGKNKVLSWIQRLEIAIDCARGLWFLHTYSEGCIVHRDIKPTNILLGPNFEAKLSDFGLSKVIDIGETHVSSEVRGTFGYVDPEYQSDRQVNSAGDVYSFGIVLLQILSGRKVINMNASNPMPLGRTAKSVTKGGNIVGFADPKLEREYSADAFELTFELALSCTGHKQERPSMGQTVERLEKAHEISVNQMTSYLHKT